MRLGRFFLHRQTDPEPIPSDGQAEVLTEEEIASARAEMGPLQVRREITNAAIKIINDARSRSAIPEEEKDRLIGRYREELSEVEGKIAKLETVVAVYELELAKKNLIHDFEERLKEIESKILETRKSVGRPISVEFKNETLELLRKTISEDHKRDVKDEKRINSEKRLGTLREEVLKAMERLEQIESEG